jgi:hypothetical protein
MSTLICSVETKEGTTTSRVQQRQVHRMLNQRANQAAARWAGPQVKDTALHNHTSLHGLLKPSESSRHLQQLLVVSRHHQLTTGHHCCTSHDAAPQQHCCRVRCKPRQARTHTSRRSQQRSWLSSATPTSSTSLFPKHWLPALYDGSKAGSANHSRSSIHSNHSQPQTQLINTITSCKQQVCQAAPATFRYATTAYQGKARAHHNNCRGSSCEACPWSAAEQALTQPAPCLGGGYAPPTRQTRPHTPGGQRCRMPNQPPC